VRSQTVQNRFMSQDAQPTTSTEVIKKTMQGYTTRGIKSFDKSKDSILSDRIRQAQKEAMKRFYSTVENEVNNQKRLATEINH
jgi:hypothetical protein